MRISARPGADLGIILQYCLQTKTRQIAHCNVNGLGQGLQNIRKRCWIQDKKYEFQKIVLPFLCER